MANVRGIPVENRAQRLVQNIFRVHMKAMYTAKYIAREVNPQESVPERSLSSPYEITYLIAVLRRQIAIWCCELKAMELREKLEGFNLCC